MGCLLIIIARLPSRRIRSFSDLMKFLIILAALAAANAWDDVAALSCKNGKADLADGQEVTIETPNTPRTTRTRLSATGRSSCLPTRRCTSGARPLTFSRATFSGLWGRPPSSTEAFLMGLERFFQLAAQKGPSNSSSSPTRRRTRAASDARLLHLLQTLGLGLGSLQLAPVHRCQALVSVA